MNDDRTFFLGFIVDEFAFLTRLLRVSGGVLRLSCDGDDQIDTAQAASWRAKAIMTDDERTALVDYIAANPGGRRLAGRRIAQGSHPPRALG